MTVTRDYNEITITCDKPGCTAERTELPHMFTSDALRKALRAGWKIVGRDYCPDHH